ncbi:hypothetical protein HK102_002982 [Quaeritorhiza haematococci]|nr:hypothetical protein HK102_002982 [Quaeritorhiza haematococci]
MEDVENMPPQTVDENGPPSSSQQSSKAHKRRSLSLFVRRARSVVSRGPLTSLTDDALNAQEKSTSKSSNSNSNGKNKSESITSKSKKRLSLTPKLRRSKSVSARGEATDLSLRSVTSTQSSASIPEESDNNNKEQDSTKQSKWNSTSAAARRANARASVISITTEFSLGSEARRVSQFNEDLGFADSITRRVRSERTLAAPPSLTENGSTRSQKSVGSRTNRTGGASSSANGNSGTLADCAITRWNSILGPVDWGQLWTYVESPSRTPFEIQLYKKILQRRLPVNHYRKHRASADHGCMRCNASSETIQHLLFDCPSSISFWKEFLVLLKSALRRPDLCVDESSIPAPGNNSNSRNTPSPLPPSPTTTPLSPESISSSHGVPSPSPNELTPANLEIPVPHSPSSPTSPWSKFTLRDVVFFFPELRPSLKPDELHVLTVMHSAALWALWGARAYPQQSDLLIVNIFRSRLQARIFLEYSNTADGDINGNPNVVDGPGTGSKSGDGSAANGDEESRHSWSSKSSGGSSSNASQLKQRWGSELVSLHEETFGIKLKFLDQKVPSTDELLASIPSI